MERSDPGRCAPADAITAHSAMQVAAWRQLWRLLLQPIDMPAAEHEAASDQEVASEETHDASVLTPKQA